jgi:hypothetical protein
MHARVGEVAAWIFSLGFSPPISPFGLAQRCDLDLEPVRAPGARLDGFVIEYDCRATTSLVEQSRLVMREVCRALLRHKGGRMDDATCDALARRLSTSDAKLLLLPGRDAETQLRPLWKAPQRDPSVAASLRGRQGPLLKLVPRRA